MTVPGLLTESVSQANTVAKGIAVRAAGAVLDIDMTVRGNPFADLNARFEVNNVNPNGKFIISAVRHVYEPDLGGYTTDVYSTGLEDRSILGLSGVTTPAPMYPGVYPAIVSNIADPEKKGRVALTFPWLDSSYVSPWARVIQLGAGSGAGLQILPSPNDEVLVGFSGGQFDSPYVIGGLYGKSQGGMAHSKMVADGKVKTTALTTKAGHQLILDDDEKSSSVTLQTTNGDSCVITLSKEKGITIETKGDRPITINSSADVNVTAAKNAKVSGQEVTVESKGAAKVNAKSSVSLTGANVTVDASSSLKLSGGMVTVQSSGKLTLKGTIVSIN